MIDEGKYTSRSISLINFPTSVGRVKSEARSTDDDVERKVGDIHPSLPSPLVLPPSSSSFIFTVSEGRWWRQNVKKDEWKMKAKVRVKVKKIFLWKFWYLKGWLQFTYNPSYRSWKIDQANRSWCILSFINHIVYLSSSIVLFSFTMKLQCFFR